MNIDIWVVYGFAGVLVILLGVQMFLRFRINDLEARNVIFNDKINVLKTKHEYLDDRITELEMDIEKLKGTIETNHTAMTARLSEIDKKQVCNKDSFDTISKTISRLEKDIDNLHDRESTDGAESDSRAISETPRPILDVDTTIPEDCNDVVDIGAWNTSDTDASEVDVDNENLHIYSWMFPKSGENLNCVTGRTYLVVGLIDKGDPAHFEDLDSCEAVWNGQRFVTRGDAWKIKKVYALIEMPEANDIMSRVFKLAINDPDCKGSR